MTKLGMREVSYISSNFLSKKFKLLRSEAFWCQNEALHGKCVDIKFGVSRLDSVRVFNA